MKIEQIKMPHKCIKCGKELYWDGKDLKDKNYIYYKDKYICKDCFMNKKSEPNSEVEE